MLPGRTGTVVDGRDIPAVADAVRGLLTDSARARRWGVAGRSWVERSWTWDAAATRLAALLTGTAPAPSERNLSV